jgi:hypothetical protein
MPQQPNPAKACGLLVRRERWGLSWRGRLLTLILLLGILGFGYRSLHPFLAVTEQLTDELLIVEGWIPVYTVHLAAEEFVRGKYRRLLIVRPLYEGEEGVLHGRHTGEYMATVLARCGVPEDSIETLYFRGSDQDRTYHSALAVRDWLSEQDEQIGGLEVATMGPHARRSRLLYRKAMSNGTRVGVIAMSDHSKMGDLGIRSMFGVWRWTFDV